MTRWFIATTEWPSTALQQLPLVFVTTCRAKRTHARQTNIKYTTQRVQPTHTESATVVAGL
jgi:hypothetical protein